MKNRLALYIITMLLLTVSICISQILPDSAQLVAWNSFKTRHGTTWVIRWDDQTGTPASIYSGRTRSYSGTPQEIARTFLRENATITKMKEELSDLQFVSVQRHRDINHVKFQQTLRSIPVEGAEYLVHVLRDGSVDMMNGTYYREIDVTLQAQISNTAALQIVRNDLGADAVLAESKAELVILPKNKEFLLTWKIMVSVQQPHGAWTYFVDAIRGTIVVKRTEINLVTGSGDVYPTHPGLSSVTSVSLYRLDGTGYLRGSYANILNNETSRAYSANHSFSYSSDNTHFDEANLYYHTDKFRGVYLASLGFNGIDQITATVHVNSWPGPNNAWFNRGTGQLYFGDGTPGQGIYDFSKEDKIVYHEYTHAMTYSIVYLPIGDHEPGAIDEGNSDYFAGSHTGRPVFGDYAAPAYARDMTDPYYSNYSQLPKDQYTGLSIAEAHTGGEFWSAALWDLYNNANIGPSVTDWLVYGGLYRINSSATFLSYREAIIAEDQAVYSGAHENAIKHTFYLRGIGTDGVQPLSVYISGPADVYHPAHGQPANQATWTANVTGGSSPFSYVWSGGGYGVGTGSSYTAYFSYDGTGGGTTQFTLRVDVTDAASQQANSSMVVTEHHSGEVIDPIANPSNGDARLMPTKFEAAQNYPNPFNPETRISFGLPEPADVTITISDLLGREIVSLVSGRYSAGYQAVTWRGTDASGNKVGSGIYFYRVNIVGESGKHFTKVMKMLLAK